jgi:hypothetical protein
MDNRTISLSEIITQEEANELVAYVAKRPAGTSVQNMVRKFIDNHPPLRDRIKQVGMIKPYASLVLEYYLQLK